MTMTLRNAACAAWDAAQDARIASNHSVRIMRGSQAAASVALMAVLLARCVVQLADAMAAAGPQLLFRSLKSEPGYEVMWQPGGQLYTIDTAQILPVGSPAQQRTQEMQWQFWQLSVVRTVQPLMYCLRVLGAIALPGDEEDEEEDEEPHTAAAAVEEGSKQKQAKWSHLLQLQQYSPEWAAAVANFSIKWPSWWLEEAADTFSLFLQGTAVMMPRVQQQFDDAVELCRTLVAIAPLPVVCNNPSCENVGGVSEAAAACKACAICKCRYCSVECQRADWKRHKPACKRMAAAGMTCA
jgi:hypothetical protein